MTRRTRWAVAAMFFVNGVGWASWASRLPAFRERLELSDGLLGLALLGATVGLFVSVILTSALVARFGSRLVTVGAGLAMMVVLPLIGWASTQVWFAAALVAYGVTNGALDLASNAQAVGVERHARRSMLAGIHAFFSAGAIVGAGTAALLAAAGVPVEIHLTATAVLSALVVIAVAPALSSDPPSVSTGPAVALPRGPLLGLGALAFCVLLAEGAVFDWSAVYLSSVAGAGPAVAAVSLAVFQLTMTIGRLLGDRLAVTVGAVRLVRWGALAGIVGLGGAIVLPNVPSALIGFAILGLGLASAFPLTLSAAARTSRVPTPTALAATTASGYTGFMVGPPLIGFVAELTDLRVAMCVVIACLALAMLLSGRLRSGGVEPTPART